MSSPIDQYRRLAREHVIHSIEVGGDDAAVALRDGSVDQITDLIVAAAVELVEQIIGEDSTHTPNAKVHVDNPQYKYPCCERVQANNSLRATQRTALRQSQRKQVEEDTE